MANPTKKDTTRQGGRDHNQLTGEKGLIPFGTKKVNPSTPENCLLVSELFSRLGPSEIWYC